MTDNSCGVRGELRFPGILKVEPAGVSGLLAGGTWLEGVWQVLG